MAEIKAVLEDTHVSWLWWHTPVNPVLDGGSKEVRNLSQAHLCHKFEPSLGCMRTCLKKIQ